MISVSMVAVVASLGAQDRLRWQVVPVPHVDVPNASITVVNAVGPTGLLTGRSGSTQSAIGWHVFTFSPETGTLRCQDEGWSLSEGGAVNGVGVVAGSLSACPDSDGACASGPAILSPDAPPHHLGPVEEEFLSIAGITDAGIAVWEQGFAQSYQTGAFISDLQGQAHSLPVPDTAFSVDVARVRDDLPGADVTIAGFAWATPYRFPMIWEVSFDAIEPSFVTTVLPTKGRDAVVTDILADGTVLGGVETDEPFGATFRPVIWSPPWDTFTWLFPENSPISSFQTEVGSPDGLLAGDFWAPVGHQATWIIDQAGNLHIIDHKSLSTDIGDVHPVEMLPDGSVLLQFFDLTTYQSRWLTWRADHGVLWVTDRLFGGDAVGEHAGMVAVGLHEGTLALNVWPDAFAAVPVAAGDVDGDGGVGVDDVLGLIEVWGPCSCLADLNGDGLAGVEDLLSVLEHWQVPGGA